jgi:pSer/pThr/pTyr-binding forkhead associated (FHA) protein
MTVLYHSRMNATLGRNFEALDSLEWLARMSDHIPDPGQHPRVSRRHARIVVSGGAATLEDLDSKNGTRLRGRKITHVEALRDGDEIRVGSLKMTFRVFTPEALTATGSEG